MDDIEYLEEYEDLIMPVSTTEGSRIVAAAPVDDESSSSIDQDIFESLFDDQSDDESVILSKKSGNQQSKQRQERESLDSLDMLVRDLGEQVNIKNEQKSQSAHESPSSRVKPTFSKPITPCLKKSNPDSLLRNSKSSDACTSSQEKPQKRVMFAKLPAMKQSLSTSPSSSKIKEIPEQPSISGRKTKDTAYATSKASDPNSQRKLNRPQLTIVRPEKIQFKDPVDDPLSLDKVESDLESLSDVSDDSLVSISDIFTSNEAKETEDQRQNTHNTSLIQSPPAHISTANLPEKVTIISDTVLTRIDTALLESLAADDSKEAFSKDKNMQNRNTDHNKTELSHPEKVQKESSKADEQTSNYEEIKDLTANKSSDDTLNAEMPETSSTSDQIKEVSHTEQTQKIEEDSQKLANTESEIDEYKEVPKEIKTISEKELSKEIVSNDENSIARNINSNTSDESQTTTTIEIETSQSDTIITESKKDSKSQDRRNSLPDKSKTENTKRLSQKVSKETNLSKESLHSEDPQLQSDESVKKKEVSTVTQTNKPDKSNPSQIVKKERHSLSLNSKGTPKKLISLKTESKKVDHKMTPTKDSNDKVNTPSKTSEKPKPISTPSRPEAKPKEISKEASKNTFNPQKPVAENSKKEVKTTVNKKEQKSVTNIVKKTKEQSSGSPSVSKSFSEDPKRESVNKKTVQESDSSKEKDVNATKYTVEKKDSSPTPSSLSTSATKQKIEKKESSQASSLSTVKKESRHPSSSVDEKNEPSKILSLSAEKKESSQASSSSSAEKKESIQVLSSEKKESIQASSLSAAKKEPIQPSSSSADKKESSDASSSTAEKTESNDAPSSSTEKKESIQATISSAEKKESTQASSSTEKKKSTDESSSTVEKKESSDASSSSAEKKESKQAPSSSAEKKDLSHAPPSSTKNQVSEKTNKSGDIIPKKREVSKSNSQVAEKIGISRKSNSNDDIRKEIKYSREGSNVSVSSVERNINPTTSNKDKRDAPAQQKTKPQIHKKTESNDSPSTNIQVNLEKKKADIKEPNPNPKSEDQGQEKKDLSEKKEIKATNFQKSDDIKKSVIADTKPNNNKVAKADTSKRKSNAAVGPKNDDSVNQAGSKQHAVTPKSSMQKQNRLLGNNATKLDTEPKSNRSPVSVKSSESSFVNKNKIQHATNVTPKTSNDKTKRSIVERPSLKRENSMVTSDNINAKRLRSSSSSEDVTKGNKSNELNLSMNTKNEKLIENTKPNSSPKGNNTTKVLKTKSTGGDLKAKEEINKDTNQTTISKSNEKDEKKTPVNNKREGISQSKDDKNKPQEKSNQNKGVTKKLKGTSVQTKKPEIASTSNNLQLSSKPSTSNEPLKSEIKKNSVETASLSSANTTSSNKKANEVSVTSDDKTNTVVDDINVNKEQHSEHAITSSTEDQKIDETCSNLAEDESTAAKIISSSDDPHQRTEKNFEKLEMVTEQNNRTKHNPSNKNQNITDKTTDSKNNDVSEQKDLSTKNKLHSSQSDESQNTVNESNEKLDKLDSATDKVLEQKDPTTSNKVKQIQSDKSQNLKKTNTASEGNKTSDKSDSTTDKVSEQKDPTTSNKVKQIQSNKSQNSNKINIVNEGNKTLGKVKSATDKVLEQKDPTTSNKVKQIQSDKSQNLEKPNTASEDNKTSDKSDSTTDKVSEQKVPSTKKKVQSKNAKKPITISDGNETLVKMESTTDKFLEQKDINTTNKLQQAQSEKSNNSKNPNTVNEDIEMVDKLDSATDKLLEQKDPTTSNKVKQIQSDKSQNLEKPNTASEDNKISDKSDSTTDKVSEQKVPSTKKKVQSKNAKKPNTLSDDNETLDKMESTTDKFLEQKDINTTNKLQQTQSEKSKNSKNPNTVNEDIEMLDKLDSATDKLLEQKDPTTSNKVKQIQSDKSQNLEKPNTASEDNKTSDKSDSTTDKVSEQKVASTKKKVQSKNAKKPNTLSDDNETLDKMESTTDKFLEQKDINTTNKLQQAQSEKSKNSKNPNTVNEDIEMLDKLDSATDKLLEQKDPTTSNKVKQIQSDKSQNLEKPNTASEDNKTSDKSDSTTDKVSEQKVPSTKKKVQSKNAKKPITLSDDNETLDKMESTTDKFLEQKDISTTKKVQQAQADKSKNSKKTNTVTEGNKTLHKFDSATDKVPEQKTPSTKKKVQQNQSKETLGKLERATDSNLQKPAEAAADSETIQQDLVEAKTSNTQTSKENSQEQIESISKSPNKTNNHASYTTVSKVDDPKIDEEEEIPKTPEKPESLINKPVIEKSNSNIDILEQTESEQINASLATGFRRQLRKRGSDPSTASGLKLPPSKALINKTEAAPSSSNVSKSVTENTVKFEESKKNRTRNTRSSCKRKTYPIDNVSEKSQTEVKQNKEANPNTEKGQKEPAEKNVLPLESQSVIDQGPKLNEISAAEHNKLTLPNKDVAERTGGRTMEEGNEHLSDSKLDSLSTTSVESTTFSGFADSPTIGSNNEKVAETNMSISTTLEHPVDSSLLKDKYMSESFSPPSKRPRTTESNPTASTVITFNEWLARKNSENSLQDKVTETQKVDSKTHKSNAEKKDTPAQIHVNSAEQTSETNIKCQPIEQVLEPKILRKPKSKPKSELERLKESMPKDLRESGIEELIESHFTSPHCLTKRSIAAAVNDNKKLASKNNKIANASAQLSIKTSSITSRAPTPSLKRLATPTPTIVSNSKVIHAQVSSKNMIKENLRKDTNISVKERKLTPNCRNLRIRLNRSVVKLYFKNLHLEASKPTSNLQLVSTQDLGKGRKRKAVAQTGGPEVKKTVTTTVLEQPDGKSTTPSQPQKQSRAARPNTSGRTKIVTTSPRSRSAATPSIAYNVAEVDPTPLPQSATTSPIEPSSSNVVPESDLLTPISEAVALATTTESSRRGKPKRPASTTISNIGRVSAVCSPTPVITTQAPPQNIQNKHVTPMPELVATVPSMTPKMECEDDYESAYIRATQQALQSDQTTVSPGGLSLSQINPSPSMESRAQVPTASSSVPLVISGATSHSLPPIVIDNSGTRIYSFLHPTKYNTSHGYVMLDYCCPNLDGPMTAIDPTRRHAKVDAAVRELPAYITMETRLVTRAELEADSNALPASIRHKVQRITGSNKAPAATKVTPSITVTTTSIVSTSLTSTNVTTTTSVPPKATTATVSAATTSSTSNPTVLSAVSASVSALQKQLPSTTTLTPKPMPTNGPGTSKTMPNNVNTGTATSTTAPTATITPTTLSDMRDKLRANLKKYDIVLKKHYPRISLLNFQQRQEIIESLTNATQLLPRDIENSTRLLQEYVTHMALKTATKSQLNSESSAPTTSTVAAVTTRAAPPIPIACTSTTGTAGIQQIPPVNTRAHSKRNYSTSNMHRKSVPIYNSDKTVIGYQVQMVPPSASAGNVSTANSTSFTTKSTRRYVKNNATVLTTSSSKPTTPRSGVFVIDNENINAPVTPLMPTSNNGTPRPYYQEPDLTPTTIATMVRTPQASSTPLSSSASIVTRSGGTTRVSNRGVTMRQTPSRGATSKIHPTAPVTPPVTIPTTSAALLPRLPTLTRNPHLPPLSTSNQPTTPMGVRNVVGIEQTLQKRLTRKTAAAELLVVNHDTHGNPLPPTEEAILPDLSSSTSAAHIKSEKPDEFPII